MSRIRSRDTSPEMIVRRLVHGIGYRYRLHDAKLPGKPDIVLPRLKRIIEVRGCFWHQHSGCIDSHVPKTRLEYWGPKLSKQPAAGRRKWAQAPGTWLAGLRGLGVRSKGYTETLETAYPVSSEVRHPGAARTQSW